jgi:hypothetical protein
MANASNPPSNIQVYPIPGVGVEVRATFTQANNLPATYARFQISTVNNFTSILYDSGQVAIQPISDGQEGVMIFNWIPTSEGTYYYRLCFWDNANYTYTGWTVWNGTTTTIQTDSTNIYPTGDYALNVGASGSQIIPRPGSPATHYDKIDETTQNGDTDYLEFDVQYHTNAYSSDYFYWTQLTTPQNFIVATQIVFNMYAVVTGSSGISPFLYAVEYNTTSTLGSVDVNRQATYNLYQITIRGNWDIATLNSKYWGFKVEFNNTSGYNDGVDLTSYFITIYYNYYQFTYTPTNESVTIHFPVFVSQEVARE